MWKEAFDRDPVNRAASGVVAHRISQPVNDLHYVVVKLDFNVELHVSIHSLEGRPADEDSGISRLTGLRGPSGGFDVTFAQARDMLSGAAEL